MEGDRAREAARRAAMRRVSDRRTNGTPPASPALTQHHAAPAPRPPSYPGPVPVPAFRPAPPFLYGAPAPLPPPPPSAPLGTERGLRWLRHGVIAHLVGVLVPFVGGIASLIGFGYGVAGFWEVYKDRQTLGPAHERSARLSLYSYIGAIVGFVLSIVLPVVIFYFAFSSPSGSASTNLTSLFIVIYVLLYSLVFQGLIALGRYYLLRELVDLKALPLLVIASMSLVVTTAISIWLQFSASLAGGASSFLSFILFYYMIGLFQLVPYVLYYFVIRGVEEQMPRLRWEAAVRAGPPRAWPVRGPSAPSTWPVGR